MSETTTQQRNTIQRLLFTALIAFAIYVALNLYLNSEFFKSNPQWLQFIFNATKDLINLLCVVIGGGAIALILFKDVVEVAWQTLFGIPFQKIANSVDVHLKTASDKTIKICETIDRNIENQTKPFVPYTCSNEKEHEEFLKYTASVLWGSHAPNGRSLFMHTKNMILDAFSQRAYRSNIEKSVALTNNDTYPDYLNWEETTRYKINNVSLKTQQKFPLEYFIKTYAPSMDVSRWSNAATLIIKIDDTILLGPHAKAEEKEDLTSKGFFVWKDGESIFLRFYTEINLYKELTNVYFKEISVSSREDKTYTINASAPIYGHMIDFTLPKDYAFKINPTISSMIGYNGLPNHSKNRQKIDDIVILQQDFDNHIRIDIKGWVLPGIITNLHWVERHPQKKE